MKFTKQDLGHSRNMLKALGKGEWKLDGMEILAFSHMMQWFSGLQKQIEEEIALEEAAAKINQPAKTAEEALAKVKTVENPVKPIAAPRKKSNKE